MGFFSVAIGYVKLRETKPQIGHAAMPGIPADPPINWGYVTSQPPNHEFKLPGMNWDQIGQFPWKTGNPNQNCDFITLKKIRYVKPTSWHLEATSLMEHVETWENLASSDDVRCLHSLGCVINGELNMIGIQGFTGWCPPVICWFIILLTMYIVHYTSL